MTTTWYVVGPLFVLASLVGVAALFHRPLYDRLCGLSPTQPSEPGDDDREASGADPEYGDDLEALAAAERELRAIAEELGLDLLDPDQAQDAEDILALRLSVAELVDHCGQRVNAIIDDFAPGWWEQAALMPLPSFGAVHALIDDTSEFAAVTA